MRWEACLSHCLGFALIFAPKMASCGETSIVTMVVLLYSIILYTNINVYIYMYIKYTVDMFSESSYLAILD